MGDESDWESVGESVGDLVDASDCISNGQVLVELPPGGIISSQETTKPSAVPPEPESYASSSFSLIQKTGGMAIKSEGSSQHSALSSYVAVPPHMSNLSVSGTTLGSLFSDFEAISLSSGKTVLRCKRCSKRHPLGTNICNVCYLALCANPCPDSDEQIALALQRREEEFAFSELQRKERKLKNLRNESPFDQAEFLSTEIVSYLKNQNLEEGFRIFSEHDLKFLAGGFIHTALEQTTEPKISLAFKVSYASEWNEIRLNGFGNDKPIKVYPIIQAAMERHVQLPSRGSLKYGWIVAMVEPCGPKSEWDFLNEGVKILDSGRQVLPLVCFDTSLSERDFINQLRQRLSGVVDDFFQEGLELSYGRDMPMPPQKKLKESPRAESRSIPQQPQFPPSPSDPTPPSPNGPTPPSPSGRKTPSLLNVPEGCVVDIEKVENGQDKRTSLKIMKIPYHVTPDSLLHHFQTKGFGPGVIDFLFLPLDTKTGNNLGYAFINFVDYRNVALFYQQYGEMYPCTYKNGAIAYSFLQGHFSLVTYSTAPNFQNTPLCFDPEGIAVPPSSLLERAMTDLQVAPETTLAEAAAKTYLPEPKCEHYDTCELPVEGLFTLEALEQDEGFLDGPSGVTDEAKSAGKGHKATDLNQTPRTSLISWNEMLEELRIYVAEQSKAGRKWDGDVPTTYYIEDKNLGRWVNRQRDLYQSGKLQKDRQLALEKVGLKWYMPATTSWDSMYDTLCDYVESKTNDGGNEWDGNVPTNYRTEDNPPRALGRWINRQRSAYGKDKLKAEYIEKLNKIGLKWSIHERCPVPTPEAVKSEVAQPTISGALNTPKNDSVAQISNGEERASNSQCQD